MCTLYIFLVHSSIKNFLSIFWQICAGRPRSPRHTFANNLCSLQLLLKIIGPEGPIVYWFKPTSIGFTNRSISFTASSCK
jgi:hypothetical protein